MAREVFVHQVRAELGDEAGSRARRALFWQACGTLGWVMAGTWSVVAVIGSLIAVVQGDRYGILLSTGWWGWLAATAAFACIGVLGYRQYAAWARRALGDRYDEFRIVAMPAQG